MISQFEAAGFTSCEDTPEDVPDIVVAAFDMTLTYKRLCRAAWWISRGLPYIATNPDRVCPTNEETVLVDCGSICRCLESATGRKPDITLGKPDFRQTRIAMLRADKMADLIAILEDCRRILKANS